MKGVFILLFLTFKLSVTPAQSLIGNYVSGEDFVIITDSTLEFMIDYGCCITFKMYGYGKYKVQNESVYVTTGNPKIGKGSSFLVLGDLPASDQINIKVHDNGLPVRNCYVTLEDTLKNKFIAEASTDASGLALLDSLPIDDCENKILTLNAFGSDWLRIPFNEISGKLIVVFLPAYEVLIDKQVAFKLIDDNNSLKLSGPFFPSIITEDEKKEKKKAKIKSIAKMIVSTWPWRWGFNSSHVPIPKIFVKQ